MEKFLAALYFRTIFRLFCLDIEKKIFIATILHKIDNFPGKMTFFQNFKNYYVEIYFVNFLAEYYGFPETEIFFFWKINFCPFHLSIALYGTVNNSIQQRYRFLKGQGKFTKKRKEKDNELMGKADSRRALRPLVSRLANKFILAWNGW